MASDTFTITKTPVRGDSPQPGWQWFAARLGPEISDLHDPEQPEE